MDNKKGLIKKLILKYNEKVRKEDEKNETKESTKKEKVKKEKVKKEKEIEEEEPEQEEEEEEEEEKPKKKKNQKSKKATKKSKSKNVEKELDTSEEEEEDNDDEDIDSDKETPKKRKRESTKSSTSSSKKQKKLTNLVYLSNQLTDIIGIRSVVPEDLYERLDRYLERNNLRVNKNEILLNDEIKKLGSECGILSGGEEDNKLKKISQYKWKQIVKNNMFNSRNVDADGVPLPV